jgi:putative transposase
MLEEALAAGARLKPACDELGIDARTVQRWRAAGVGDDGRHGPRTSPTNKLSDAERRKLLSTANSPEFRNLSPKQIVPRLADRGEYIASESTFYRVLREADQMKHRGPAKPPMRRHRPTPRVATAPNQVWSWDITYLRSTVAGRFFYLYVFVDVWSRKVVAWAVHERECTDLAAQMLEAALQAEGLSDIELVLHSDNGSPMKGATLRATMERLGITPSYSRPSVSNDNPFSESLFATAKGRPEYPRRPFKSCAEAHCWAAWFVAWYHSEHLHSGIGFVTPLQRHEGHADAILERRRAVYTAARSRHPNRWSGATRAWTAPSIVHLNPAVDDHGEGAIEVAA